MPEYEWINENLFTVRNFFALEECAKHVEASEEMGYGDAPINTSVGPVMASDVRNNARVIHDDEALAAEIWARCRDYVPVHLDGWEAIGLNERFRYYRYDVDQQFDWHSDGYYQRLNGQRSHFTLMVYLNDDFKGGSTTVENTDIQPEIGMALGFRHYLVHKGQPVTAGRKYVLRTDVMYRLVPDKA